MSRIYHKKNRSDWPVIVVAIATGLVVMALVALFLVWLPNRGVEKELRGHLEDLNASIENYQIQSESLPDSRKEMKKITKDMLALESEYTIDPESLKKTLLADFDQPGFAVNEYFFGSSIQGDDPWWVAYPLDFTIYSKREKIADTLAKWRDSVPEQVRLIEVDLKPIEEEKDLVSVTVLMRANSLVPREKLDYDLNRFFEPRTLPEKKYFETSKLTRLRKEIRDREKDMLILKDVIQEVETLKMDRSRLLAISSRRAQFKAEHSREFDMLVSQLSSIMSRNEGDDTVRILIKLQETNVQKPKPITIRPKKDS